MKTFKGLSLAFAILLAWALIMAAGMGVAEMAKSDDGGPQSAPAIY